MGILLVVNGIGIINAYLSLEVLFNAINSESSCLSNFILSNSSILILFSDKDI